MSADWESRRHSRRDMMGGSAALAAALAAGRAVPAFAADRFGPVRNAIRGLLADPALPSVTVAVMERGQIVWEEGFGWADRERRVPASPHVPYSLASISKPITATGLMTLVDAGKIDLERPVNDYLGNAPLVARVGEARDATVRRVAGHTAGLPIHFQFFYADQPVARPPFAETIARYGNLVTPPGERYQYSNLGYGVLDAIISNASGASYADFMRQEVFRPLGLSRTTVDAGGDLGIVAARYGRNGKPLPRYSFAHMGASAVYASAHDLVRFAALHLPGRRLGRRAILSKRAIAEMQRAVDPMAARDPGIGYGLGLNIATRGGYRIVWHNGSMAGVSTAMTLFPDAGIAIVVLANAGGNAPRTISNLIARILLPDWTADLGPVRQPDTPFVPPTGLAGGWRGKIVSPDGEVGLELDISPEGAVTASVAGQSPVALVKPRMRYGYLEGALAAQIPDRDMLSYPYGVQLSLKLRGDRLNGVAVTVADELPDRLGNGLAHWTDLGRIEGKRA